MNRNELYEELKKQGIYARKYFYPLTSDQACFKNKYRDADLKCARELAEKVLVLSVYEELHKGRVENICEMIEKIV